MERFMDTTFQKRYTLLTILKESNTYSETQDQLAKQLEITLPTLHSTAKLIQNDLKTLGYEDSVQLVYHSDTKSYTLTISEKFSLLFLRFYYYEHSLRFQLVTELLYDKKETIQDLATRHHTTYSTVWRELKYLQTTLPIFDLSLTLHKGCRIKGDELTIRSFYLYLFQNIYGSYKWPFTSISKEQIASFLEEIPTEIFQLDTLDKHIPVFFFTAISFLRVGKIKRTENKLMYEPTNTLSEQEFSRALQRMSSFVPSVSAKTRSLELKFLCSVILSLGSYEGIAKIPDFFVHSISMKEMGFSTHLDYIVGRIEYYLLRKLEETEQQELLYKLSLIYYRVLFFDSVLLSESMTWNLKTFYPFSVTRYRRRIVSFIGKKELVHFPIQLDKKYNQYLISQIYSTIFQTLDKNAYKIELNILIFSVSSHQKIESFLRNILDNAFNLHFVTQQNEAVDLIISDSLFSKDFFPFLNETTPVFYIDEHPKIENMKQISAAISEVSAQKYCRLKSLDLEKTLYPSESV